MAQISLVASVCACGCVLHEPRGRGANYLLQYPEPPKVAISDGTFTFSADKQTLEYFHDVSQGSVHTLTLSPGISALK